MMLDREGPVLADYVAVADGVQLFCRHAGSRTTARPPMIFLHGNRDNHSHYADLQEQLGADQYTVAVDFRGHGLSSTLDVPLSAALFADDIERLILHYEWDKVVLAGHSLGSAVAITLADRRPDLVDRLVLMGSAASFSLPFQRPEHPPTKETWSEYVREANARALPFFFHDKHPDVARRVSAAWSVIAFEVHQNLVRMRHPGLEETIRRLTVPALVVAGAQDKCTTVEQAEWIQGNHRDARLSVIPETAHFMYMERPELVAEAIRAFLLGR
ncbi:alpha/beta fold hydrolase [Nonomuraea pusilla]|uniref:Pimeloyl-ACP methyl ester carboxylesterase n=1 Tax=Nonomuraea pusilla TaxID=46177 RepID=A0A1H8CBH1_9ACTN|nr:alpha/beta hydrolase [Nonomuraea pusilla]SEM92366.1 Pimeloyl-ACP methyl ester carboxylesterase [Nonomuraea pusilla]